MSSNVIPWIPTPGKLTSAWEPASYPVFTPNPTPEEVHVATISWRVSWGNEDELPEVSEYQEVIHNSSYIDGLNPGLQVGMQHEEGSLQFLNLAVAAVNNSIPLAIKFKGISAAPVRTHPYVRGIHPSIDTYERKFCGFGMGYTTFATMLALSTDGLLENGRLVFELYCHSNFEEKITNPNSTHVWDLVNYAYTYRISGYDATTTIHTNNPTYLVSDTGVVSSPTSALSYEGVTGVFELGVTSVPSMYELLVAKQEQATYPDMGAYTTIDSINVSGTEVESDSGHLAVGGFNIITGYDFTGDGFDADVQRVLDEVNTGVVTLGIGNLITEYPVVETKLKSTTYQGSFYDYFTTSQDITGIDECWVAVTDQSMMFLTELTSISIYTVAQRDSGRLIKFPYGPTGIDLGAPVSTFNASGVVQGYFGVTYILPSVEEDGENAFQHLTYADGQEVILTDYPPIEFPAEVKVPGHAVDVLFSDVYLPVYPELSASKANITTKLARFPMYEVDSNLNIIRQVNKFGGTAECDLFSFHYLAIQYNARRSDAPPTLRQVQFEIRINNLYGLSSYVLESAISGIRIDGTEFSKTDGFFSVNSSAGWTYLTASRRSATEAFVDLTHNKLINDGGFSFELVLDI